LKILGIDPGIQNLGVALLENGILRTAVEHRPRGRTLALRLLDLQRFLEEIVEAWHPEMAALEQVIYHRNVRAALTLGAARGVALVLLARHGIPIHELPPARVKQAITGNGRASKAQVRYMVQRLAAHPEPLGEHAADAAACALALQQTLRHAVPSSRTRRR